METINFEKKKMIPLKKENQESNEGVKNCYILLLYYIKLLH